MGDSHQRVRVTWAQAVRDIVVTSMNRGQLPGVIMGGILLVVFWRLPSEELVKVVNSVLANLANFSFVGYLLFMVTVVGWAWNSRRLRRMATREQDRIGNEKSRLQERAGLAGKVRSSKHRSAGGNQKK